MRKYIFVFILPSLLFITSCDKIHNPIEPKKGTYNYELCPPPDSFPAISPCVKKILLEHFTGHKCPYCYEAEENILPQEKNLYGEKMINVSIHASDLAKPNSSGPLTYDFRTNVGDTYYAAFGSPPTLPAGLVNRTYFLSYTSPGILYLSRDNWAGADSAIINMAPEADIRIINEYNNLTRTLCTHLQSEFLNSMAGTFNVVILITEDSIMKPQTKGVSIVPYIHRHVLRDAINGAWGDTLVKNNAIPGVYLKKNYTYTLNPTWDPAKCSVVGFIYDVSNYRIIQAEEKKIM
jgi:hypothetical protein